MITLEGDFLEFRPDFVSAFDAPTVEPSVLLEGALSLSKGFCPEVLIFGTTDPSKYSNSQARQENADYERALNALGLFAPVFDVKTGEIIGKLFVCSANYRATH
jgi:hypothetical protein